MTNEEFEKKLKKIESNIEILDECKKVNEELEEVFKVMDELGGNE